MSGRTRFPFTAAQWQELEHQALIFKYMISGIPVPPDLLFTIKRSYLETPFISRLFPQQYQDVGLNYLQMGSGRKIDSEPGRCRRTDGKKWRCSKEAYPDSKYCERHMHRGKNRSRKPVEVLKTTTVLSSNPSTPAISSITQNSPLSSSSSSFYSLNNNSETHPFLYHYGSSSRPSGSILQQNTNPPLMLDSDYRRNKYVYGVKEDVDHEQAFLSSSTSRQKNWFGSQSEYSSYLQLQSCGDYAMGNSKIMERDEPEKTMHHFFDEWSSKERETWGDLDDKSSNTGSSATRLSMSIADSSHHDFSIFSKLNDN